MKILSTSGMCTLVCHPKMPDFIGYFSKRRSRSQPILSFFLNLGEISALQFLFLIWPEDPMHKLQQNPN